MRRLSGQTIAKWLPTVAIFSLAAVLLFWELDEKYLWQDEANTAVLAVRTLRFGRPLAWDGVNFISLDDFLLDDDATVDQRTHSAKSVVDFYVRKGYIKPDTAWKWSPWGQFLVAAASIKLFGQTTLAARLPFAIASLLTVFALYRLVLPRGGRRMAQIAALILTLNAYWILHGRQSRYYALSSFFFVLTLWGYARWKEGGRWGAAAFIAAAWCWFQSDYGTIIPVLAVLFLETLVTEWWRPRKPLLVWSALGASLAPFVWYYELWHREGSHLDTWLIRLSLGVFNFNEYILALPLLAAAIVLLVWWWPGLPSAERRIVALSIGALLAITIWVPTVAVVPFVRYMIALAPAACFLAAWFLVRVFPAPVAWFASLALVFTPLLSFPVHLIATPPQWYTGSPWYRAELIRLRDDIFGHPDDVNRELVRWLRANTLPTSQILINYEDLPLMYYLPNPIRGGIAAFRVEDDSKSPPDVAVIRNGLPFTHWPAFQRELRRYHWARYDVLFPAVLWGNNPDPLGALDTGGELQLLVMRRIP